MRMHGGSPGASFDLAYIAGCDRLHDMHESVGIMMPAGRHSFCGARDAQKDLIYVKNGLETGKINS